MALTLNQAQTLLASIVGKSGSARYLGLSKTQPQPISTGTLPVTSVSFSNYNITEPASTTSYARVPISASEFANTATGTYVGSDYVTTIKNTKEIHFTEALQDWGYYKYFFITTDGATRSYSSNSVVYVGELVYDKYVADTTYADADFASVGISTTGFDKTKTTSSNFNARKDYLYIKDGENYINCAEKTFDEAATYYTQGLGVFIAENTVPLVRATLLKISVQ